MNNILLNKLPHSVNIGGLETEINTSFRTSILFEKKLSEYNLDNEEEQIKLWNDVINLYYNEEIPNDLKIEAVNKAMWFYRCGQEFEENKKVNNQSKGDIYSFDYDADKIYSAFLDQYNLDLQDTDIHWWKFKAMFNSLKDDNEISKIMSIRAVNLSEIGKEQQNYYRKLKKLYAIPCRKEDVERSKGLAEILRKGKELT